MYFITKALKNADFEPQDELIVAPNTLNGSNAATLQNMIESFAKGVNPEEVLLFIDMSWTGSGKKGLLLSADKVYTHLSAPIAYKDIKSTKSFLSALYINNVELGLPISTANTKVLLTTIQEIIAHVKKEAGIDDTNISQDITSADELQDTQTREKFVRGVLSTIEFDLSDTNVIFNPDLSNEKFLKKINNAINTYAKGVNPEDVILLCDATWSGNCKKGLLFTADKIYSHESSPISYFELKKATKTMSGLKVNGKNRKLLVSPHNVRHLAMGLQFIISRFESAGMSQESYQAFTKRSKFKFSIKKYIVWALIIVLVGLFFYDFATSNAFREERHTIKMIFGGLIFLVIIYFMSKGSSSGDSTWASALKRHSPVKDTKSVPNNATDNPPQKKEKESERREVGEFRIDIGGMDQNAKIRVYEQGGVYSLKDISGTAKDIHGLEKLIRNEYKNKKTFVINKWDIKGLGSWKNPSV